MLFPRKKRYINVAIILSTLIVSACSQSPKIENRSKSQVIRVSYQLDSGLKESHLSNRALNTEEINTQTHPQEIHSQDNTVQSDRWEFFNRKVFRFNRGLDNLLVKPAAKAYKFIMPELLDTGVSNFFSNLDDIGNALNNLLQFKPRDAVNDSARFLFNSSFGLGGFLDIASEMELEKHNEDFGQTLAKWGVGSGPFLMLPALGPSTLRDATMRLTVDRATNPSSYHDESLAFTALDLLDTRADLLRVEEAFKDIADDQYGAVRDAWLQRREFLIRDGVVDEKKQSDMIDELESLDNE